MPEGLKIVKREPLSIAKREPVAAEPPAPQPTQWTRDYPTTAALTKATLDALPGIGGLVGGVVATPESGGAMTVPGVAFGAGIGRGLRDLIAEAIGVDAPTGATSKGTRIALDAATSAAFQKAIPGLVEAARTPGQTAKEAFNVFRSRLPSWLADLVKLPQGLEKAPSRVLLERPAWQIWEQAEKAAAAETPMAATTRTGTGPLSVPSTIPTSIPPAPTNQAAMQAVKAFDAVKQMPQRGELSNVLAFMKRGDTAEAAVAKVLANRPTPQVSPAEAFMQRFQGRGAVSTEEAARDVAAKNARTTRAKGGTKN